MNSTIPLVDLLSFEVVVFTVLISVVNVVLSKLVKIIEACEVVVILASVEIVVKSVIDVVLDIKLSKLVVLDSELLKYSSELLLFNAIVTGSNKKTLLGK